MLHIGQRIEEQAQFEKIYKNGMFPLIFHVDNNVKARCTILCFYSDYLYKFDVISFDRLRILIHPKIHQQGVLDSFFTVELLFPLQPLLLTLLPATAGCQNMTAGNCFVLHRRSSCQNASTPL